MSSRCHTPYTLILMCWRSLSLVLPYQQHRLSTPNTTTTKYKNVFRAVWNARYYYDDDCHCTSSRIIEYLPWAILIIGISKAKKKAREKKKLKSR